MNKKREMINNSRTNLSKRNQITRKNKNNSISVYVYGAIVLFWMTLIFFFSSQDATQSGDSSSELTHVVLDALTQLGIICACNISPAEFTRAEGIIRTLAHFFEYFAFSIITYQFIRSIISNKSVKNLLLPLLICMTYALSDEIHQYFVPGRAMDIMDWIVDSSGILIASLIMFLFHKARRNIEQ